MRLVQLTIPQDKRDVVIDTLEQRNLEFTLVDETSGRGENLVVSVPVETGSVEEFLDTLDEIGISRNGYAIITDVEATLSQSNDRTSPNSKKDDSFENDRISREELQTRATEMAAFTPSYIFFTVVSAIVASAGLLTDSAAVVVGSMVIAPLLGPAVGASVGSIVNDDELFRESVKSQLFGLGLAVISGTVFAYAVKLTVMPNVDIRSLSEVASRINPGALSLVIALGSGAAGAFSLSTGASTPLVGVMIAAALIPPAAALGLGIAYWQPVLIVSVTILLLVNVLSINFASLGILWMRGYRPSHWFEERIAKKATVKRLGVLLIGILILSSFLIATTVDMNRNAEFESTVEGIAAESDARILSITISYETQLFSRQPDVVTIHAATESDQIASQLSDRISAETSSDVSVVVIRESVESS